MNLNGFQITKALLVFLVVISLGLALQYYLQQTQIVAPLTKKLQDLPGVAQAQLIKKGISSSSPILVSLALEEDVPLALSVQGVQEALRQYGGEILVELEDTADLPLWNLYQKIQVVVEEAVVTGGFTLLEERVASLATAESVDWDVALDRDYIYLRLQRGQKTLQRVINRHTGDSPLRIVTKGGVANAKVD